MLPLKTYHFKVVHFCPKFIFQHEDAHWLFWLKKHNNAVRVKSTVTTEKKKRHTSWYVLARDFIF